MIERNQFNWYVIFILAFFIAEAIYKILLWNGLGHFRISAVVKLIAQSIIFLILFPDWRKIKKPIFLLTLLLLSFLIGQLTLTFDHNAIFNLEYFNNAVYIILMLLFFNHIILTGSQKEFGIKIMESIFILNGLVTIIGAVFSIRYFETYFGQRFGYDGFIMKSSYASYFNLFALFYVTHKYFLLKKLNLYTLLIVFLASILSGTKGSLLAVVLVSSYFMFKKKIYKKKYFVIALSFFTLLVIIFHQDIYNWICSNTVFGPIIEEHGYLTALLSFRDLILVHELLPYIDSNWSLINYLFGGMGDIMIKSGLELVDLIYFFGFLGVPVYLYLFKLTLFPVKYNRDLIALSTMIIIISSFAGNFFYNSSLAIFLVGIKLYLNSNNENRVS